MKTFDDLVFISRGGRMGSQATMEFENGYGVSVLLGDLYYSNGIDTYELGVTYNGELTYNTPITDDVLGRISKDEVTEAMKQVQELTC